MKLSLYQYNFLFNSVKKYTRIILSLHYYNYAKRGTDLVYYSNVRAHSKKTLKIVVHSSAGCVAHSGIHTAQNEIPNTTQ